MRSIRQIRVVAGAAVKLHNLVVTYDQLGVCVAANDSVKYNRLTYWYMYSTCIRHVRCTDDMMVRISLTKQNYVVVVIET